MNHINLRLWIPLMAASLALACDKPQAPQASPPDKPQRIVSFSPGLTEIAFDIGLGDKIVGVSRFATFPPEVASIEKVGGMMDPNLEKTLSLRPDLILTSPSVRGIEALAREKSIPIVLSRTDSLNDVFATYTDLGKTAGVEARAAQSLSALKGQIEALRYSGTKKPRVLLVIGRDPGALTGLYAAGPTSFLDELLTLAGGTNALPTKVGKWPKINLESLLTNPPDLILEFVTTGSNPTRTAEAKAAWKKAPALTTAQRGHVQAICGDHVLLPGPRLTQTLDAIGVALAPYQALNTPPPSPK